MARLISARRSGIHGKGVFALQDIPKGTTLCEYIGKQLTHAEADAKYAGNVGTGHTFLFTLNDDYIIDANQGGGVAR
ncbi:MAG: SET domain-containing protein-lysine N-methyltransferase, partial [Flavobacteriales bacterium]|nr:SET domain-containing protein-lysine N-methyltransferase [Flavobacteriales bacterium]